MEKIKLFCEGGLGNRIRAINSLFNWCLTDEDKIEQPIEIYWVIGDDLNARFEDIFQPLPNTLIRNIYKKSIAFLFYKLKFHYIFDVLKKKNTFKGVKNIDVKYVDVKGESIKIFSYHKYHAIDTSYVQFKDEVVQRAKLPKGDYVGIHIRQGDNVKAIKNSPLSLFINKIEEIRQKDPETIFFLCTDSEEAKKELIGLYPHNILTGQREINRATLNGIYDAIADIITLANASYIIGSFYSSFSEVAAEFHKTPLEILKADN